MKTWIARRLAAWLAPLVVERLTGNLVAPKLAAELAPYIEQRLPCFTAHADIERFEQAARTAVENGVIARHMVEELANALGYEVVFSGVDSVQVLPLNKN